jgi:hypothetical protein
VPQLALLVASPLIFRHIKTGRYKRGWFLSKNKATPTNLATISIIAQTVNRSPDVPIGHQNTALQVKFRQIYAMFLLKTIPWIQLTIGRFILLFVGLSHFNFYLFIGKTLFKWIIDIKMSSGSTTSQVILHGFLFGLIYKNTAEPLRNFKRPGWIAAIFLPLQFLLAMKNSPISLIGKSYERVNYIHRFIGV